MPIYWYPLEETGNDIHDPKYRKNIKLLTVKAKVCGTDDTGDVISLVPLFQDQLLKIQPDTLSY